MANRKSVHTVPKGSRWANVLDGKVVSTHRLKDAAMDSGRSQARTKGAEHVIHNRDGRISQSNSYGGDPCPPRDKK
jgi:hypothetical protein